MKTFKQKVNDIILLMHLEQQMSNQQRPKNLSIYIENLDELEKYHIFQELIDNGLTNWEVRKGAHNHVAITKIEPNLTRKGVELAEFLIKPFWLRFLIVAKNKIIALIIILLGLGIFSINININ